jgi:hypothetical protein
LASTAEAASAASASRKAVASAPRRPPRAPASAATARSRAATTAHVQNSATCSPSPWPPKTPRASRLPSLRGSPRPWEHSAGRRRSRGVGHRRGGVVHQAPAAKIRAAPTGGGGRSNARPVLGGAAPAASWSCGTLLFYLAARLPGLDSRRAAACFSSSSPVGAMVERCV